MTEDIDKSDAEAVHHLPEEIKFPLELVTIVIALLLALLGIAITDYSPLKSYQYWASMLLFLVISGLAIGWSRARREDLPIAKTLAIQLVHWSATAFALGGIFLLLKAGRLNYEGTGLVMLNILGLATFLDGCRVNWRFSMIGVLLFVTSIIAAFLEEYLWVLLIFAGVIALVIVFWERYEGIKRRRLENKVTS